MKLRDAILAGKPGAFLFIASRCKTHADAVQWIQAIHRKAGAEVPDAAEIDALIFEGETEATDDLSRVLADAARCL